MQFAAQVIDNLNLAAKAWERGWDRSIIQNFLAGGRPKWKAVRRGGMPLQKTGRLRNSTNVFTQNEGSGKYVFVARVQSLRYARIHQYGGVIRPVNVKALPIPLTPEAAGKRPKDFGDKLFLVKSKKGKAPTLCISKGKGKGARVIPQYVLLRAVTIPARPYLVVQREDGVLLKQRMKKAIGLGLKAAA